MRQIRLEPYTVIRDGLPYLRVGFQSRTSIYMHIAPIIYEPNHEQSKLILRLRRRIRPGRLGPRITALKTQVALAALDQDFPNGGRVQITCEGKGVLDPVAASISQELEMMDFVLAPGFDDRFMIAARRLMAKFPLTYYSRVREVLLEGPE